MLELPHVLVGASIAIAVPYPQISLPLAFVSHFVLDLLPHWNPHPSRLTPNLIKLLIIDSGLSLLFGLAIASRFLPQWPRAAAVLACCFLAVVPDLVEIPYYFFKWKPPFLTRFTRSHTKIQNNAPLSVGIATQAAVITISLLLLVTV